MLKFTLLNEKNLKRVQKYTKDSPYLVCDISAGVLYMWNDVFNVSFAIFNDTLILKCCFKNKFTAFFLPVGKDVSGALLEIERYAESKHIPLNFMCVEEEYLPMLEDRYGEDIKSEYDRDFSDYIYDYQRLKTLVGKKFSGQRNHINAFKKAYPNYKFKKLEYKDVPRVLEFLKEYKKEHKSSGRIEKNEFKNTLMLVNNLKVANFIGYYMEIDGKMCSFTIGEYVGKTLVIHIEKALKEYRGIYPTTFNEFLKACEHEGVVYINREDDSGDLGLRTSKLQYQPEIILSKYFVEVGRAMKIKRRPVIKGDGIVLSAITQKDKKDYYNLYVNKTLNKYWGYDYKKDIEIPSEDAFYNLQLNDFKQKDNLCLAIREVSGGKMLGEVVLHNFTYDKKVEVGVRLLKKYQGKGFASKAVKLICAYAKSLGLTPVSKCYLQNEKSYKCLVRAGMVESSRDKKFIYLES